MNFPGEFYLFFFSFMDKMEHMVYFFAELGLTNYVTMMFCPSMLAASAVYAARCTLNKSPVWDETLKLHTGYSEAQLLLVNQNPSLPPA